MKSENFVKFVYSSVYCCDITYISTVPPDWAAQEINQNYEKS